MVTFTKNAGVQGQKWKKWKEIIQILIKRYGDCQNAEILSQKKCFVKKYGTQIGKFDYLYTNSTLDFLQ